jgi:hypothetical protein
MDIIYKKGNLTFYKTNIRIDEYAIELCEKDKQTVAFCTEEDLKELSNKIIKVISKNKRLSYKEKKANLIELIKAEPVDLPLLIKEYEQLTGETYSDEAI